MSRDELPEALRSIREDVETWLAAVDRQPLRRWLLEPVAEAPNDPLSTIHQRSVPHT
jgi:hypothetical protein